MLSLASRAGGAGAACRGITPVWLSVQALNEEIVNRKKNVDQAIRNGQALLKQTTGNAGLETPDPAWCSLGQCSAEETALSWIQFPLGSSHSSCCASRPGC